MSAIHAVSPATTTRRQAPSVHGILAGLAASALIMTAACATGPATTLSGIVPAEITLGLAANGSSGLCPGFVDDLIIHVVDTDGKRHSTTGPGGGHLLWPNFDIAMTGGNVDLSGRIRLIPNPERLALKPPVMRITPIHWSKRGAERRVPVRFDCEFRAHFGGRPGRRGKPGAAGHAVKGTVSMLATPRGPLVRVVLTGQSRGGSFLLEPGKGTLLIAAVGGEGADADKERGFAASPGGAGGSVLLTVDPAAKPYIGQITFDVSGGRGGLELDGTRAPNGNVGPAPRVEHGKVFEPL